MKRIPIKVTDHAALRYLQRVKGVDIDAVKAEVALLVDAACEHANATAVTRDGYRYVLNAGVVITVAKITAASIRTAGRVKDHRS